MGMDDYGQNPKSDAGKYFWASVWSWRPIHSLIYELCSDLLEEETLQGMGFNSGAGPLDQATCTKDQATCTKMAARFELWMEQHVQGHEVDLGVNVAPDGRLLFDEELPDHPDVEYETAHQVEDDHLKEWIEFLRHCGGFEVW